MDGWMDEWMDGWMDGWWMDGWMDGGWMDGGWMDGWVGGWVDGWTSRVLTLCSQVGGDQHFGVPHYVLQGTSELEDGNDVFCRNITSHIPVPGAVWT